jgi:hypothetical protein
MGSQAEPWNQLTGLQAGENTKKQFSSILHKAANPCDINVSTRKNGTMTRHDAPVEFIQSWEIKPISLTLLLLARSGDILSGIMALSQCYPNVPVNNDEKLRELLQLLKDSQEGSNEQKRLTNELILLIPQLTGFRKTPDPNPNIDFEGAVNEAYGGFFKTFPTFLHQLDLDNIAEQLRERLVRRFNQIIQNKVADQYRKLGKQPFTVSLNAPIQGNEGEEFDSEGVLDDTTEHGIEQLIEREQAEKIQHIGRKLRQYIEEDPTGELRKNYPNEKIDKKRPNTRDNLRPRPDANCHVLAQRLLLKDPPDDLSAIAREFKISRPTLDSQWKRKGQEHVKKMATNFGYEPENDPE